MSQFRSTLIEMINLKRSKNVDMFNYEDKIIFGTFMNLGNDHMEQKDITRLEKLLERGIVGLVKEWNLVIKTPKVSMYLSLSYFRTSTFNNQMRRFNDENYEYYTFKYTPATKEDLIAIENLKALYEKLHEIANLFYVVRESRWMRNGIIPKTLLKNPPIKEYIKGKLSTVFHATVLDLADNFRKIQIQHWKEIVENKSKTSLTYDVRNKKYYTPEAIAKNIEIYIDETINSFTYRLVDKLGGFEPISKISKIEPNIRSLNYFDIHFTFENGDTFTLDGGVVNNVSPLGNSYVQFPIIFRNINVGGVAIPNGETNFKKAFKIK